MAEFDFTIGADPEFVCIDGRTLIESGAYTNTENELGCDNNNVLFEVRPEPSMDPLEIVGNIHDIFSRWIHSHKDFQKFSWRAGSHYGDQCMGGHIHFGIKPSKIATADCLPVLDNYVGVISLLIENRNQGLRRRQNGNYGRMGDTRPQAWGFEYRTSSSWVTSPYVSAAMLCLAKTIMYEFVNNQHFIPRAIVAPDDFVRMNVDKLYRVFPQLWNDITGMELYQKYKPYLDLIYFLVNKRLSWFPGTNMKEAWGLVDLTKAYVNRIKMDSIWEKFKQEIDVNGCAITVPVARRRR